jgi:hypothetical protein
LNMTSADDVYDVLVDEMEQLWVAAAALLNRIDHITTEEFSKGGERNEREALRQVLANIPQRWR